MLLAIQRRPWRSDWALYLSSWHSLAGPSLEAVAVFADRQGAAHLWTVTWRLLDQATSAGSRLPTATLQDWIAEQRQEHGPDWLRFRSDEHERHFWDYLKMLLVAAPETGIALAPWISDGSLPAPPSFL